MINQWDIYLCGIDPTQGTEQNSFRPVLVLSNDAINHALPISTVAPLSTIKDGAKIYPTEVLLSASASGLNKDSVIMIQQLRMLPHEQLAKKAAHLSNDGIRNAVRQALREYFDI